jgi:hypothetical protein
MSRSVDLFIGSSLPIDQVAEMLHTRSGAQLVPTVDPQRWRFIDGAVTADLYEHPYVDDGELWLSRYRYVLSTRMAEGVGPVDSAEVLGLRHLAQVLHDPAELPVLLVLDLQYRIGPAARGESRGRVEAPDGLDAPGGAGGPDGLDGVGAVPGRAVAAGPGGVDGRGGVAGRGVTEERLA